MLQYPSMHGVPLAKPCSDERHFMEQNAVFLLIGAAIVLGLIAVLIDRLNFPQRRFRPKAVAVDHKGRAARDRTGAHILDIDESPEG